MQLRLFGFTYLYVYILYILIFSLILIIYLYCFFFLVGVHVCLYMYLTLSCFDNQISPLGINKGLSYLNHKPKCWIDCNFGLIMALEGKFRNYQSNYNSSPGGHERLYQI